MSKPDIRGEPGRARNWGHAAWVLLACASLCASPCGAAGSSTVSEYRARFKVLLARIEQERQSECAQVQTGYAGALDRIGAGLRKRGNLDDYLACQKEKQRFISEKTVPEISPEGLPESVVKAQDIYRSSLSRARESSGRKTLDVTKKYIRAMQSQQASLTAANDIEGAVLARDAIKAAQFVLDDAMSIVAQTEAATETRSEPEEDVPVAPAESGIRTAGELKAALNRVNPLYTDVGRVVIRDGKIVELHLRYQPISDITPLMGIPLEKLDLVGTRVQDLSALRGMPLAWLNLTGVKGVMDISPLRGAPLVELHARGTSISDLAPLSGAPLVVLNLCGTGVRDENLEALRGMRLQNLTLESTAIADISALQGIPLNYLNLNRCRSLRDISAVKGMPLQELHIHETVVKDFSPLSGLPLARLNLGRTNVRNSDVQRLRGMPLTWLNMEHSLVSDMIPLKGMPLTYLNLNGCTNVRDLSPLQGMPLAELHVSGSNVRVLTPIEGMRLRRLNISGTDVTNKELESIKDMPLTHIWMSDSHVTDIGVLSGMPLVYVNITGSSRIRDISALKDAPLRELHASGTGIADISVLRDKNVTTLNLARTKIRDVSPLRGKTFDFLDLHGTKFTRADINR